MPSVRFPDSLLEALALVATAGLVATFLRYLYYQVVLAEVFTRF